MDSEVDNAGLRARAALTLERVRAGMESQQQVPLVAQLVRLIKEISGRADKMSIDELVEAVSAEPTTLARVMAVANSMVYNPSGGEITSLHQAVLAVGFERVRHLAISILLLETAQSDFAASANRELAGLALISGLIAAEMGRRFVTVEPDVAFVCAALRSYGRMLLATFMAEDYSAMSKRCAEGPTDKAFQATFGLTPIELGREVLARQQLPKLILDTMVDVSEEIRNEAHGDPAAALASAADFSLRMGEILQSPTLTSENFVPRVEALTHQFDPALQLTELPIKDLLGCVSHTLTSFSAKSGLPLNSVVLFRRVDCLARSKPLPPAFIPSGRTAVPASVPVAAAGPSKTIPDRDEPTLRAAKSLDDCINTISHLVREPHPDFRRIFEILIRTLQQTLNLSNCLLFIRHRQSGLFRVTRGVGPLLSFSQNTIALDPTLPSIFSEPITEARDCFIRDPNEPALRSLVPEWLCPANQVVPILLLPIRTSSGTFALVCATFTQLQDFALAEKLQLELRHLGDQVALVGDILA